MARKKSRPEKVGALHRKAEKVPTERGKTGLKKQPPDAQKLIHELKVHQGELEMKNEELRRAQLELEEAKTKYEESYDFAPVGYFTLDKKARIVEANLTGARLLGAERSSLKNEPFSLFVLPEFLNHFHFYHQHLLQGDLNQVLELKLRKRDGTSFYASLRCIACQESEGQSTQVRCAVTDITERKRMEEDIRQSRDELEMRVQDRTAELAKANEVLQAEFFERRRTEESLRESEKRLHHLSYRLLDAQEGERKRIAGELHDSIGQSLSALKFTLERKLSLMKKGKPPAGIALEDIVLMMQNCIDENRRIMTNLRPSILDDLGILATLNWFLREFQKAYPHLNVQQQFAIREDQVPDHLKIIIYRVLQEATNNFVRHSKGDRVFLSLSKKGMAIEFMIQDNGAGFDPGNLPRGMGLSSMEERVKLSGGAFGIESAPGKGSMIRATWSL